MFQKHPLCLVFEKDIWISLWYPSWARCEEFSDIIWFLTNVSIWRNQDTNRPLSPSDIPDVRPWQPGLREAWRFSLTAVSPGLVLLRVGPNASCVGPLWTVFGWKRGRRGWIRITTQCRTGISKQSNIKTRFDTKLVLYSQLFMTETYFFWTSGSIFFKSLYCKFLIVQLQ